MKRTFLAVLVGMGIGVVPVLAQEHDHAAHQAQAQAQTEAAHAGHDMGGMACMKQREEVAALVKQVAASFAAIEKESNNKALKAKIAEHAKLVQQLEAKAAAPHEMCPMCAQMHEGMKH